MISRVQAAWLAAALDGEGSIAFTVEKKADRQKRRKYQLFARLRLQLSNDVFAFVQKAQRLTGGGADFC